MRVLGARAVGDTEFAVAVLEVFSDGSGADATGFWSQVPQIVNESKLS